MRYLILLFLSVVLFSSCSLTKRKYMPGYTMDWSHKAPKTSIVKERVTSQNVISTNQTKKIAPKEINKLPAISNNAAKPEREKLINLPNPDTKTLTRIISSVQEPLLFNHTILPDDSTKTEFFTGDEQENDHARRTITYAILSSAIPAITYIILYIIAVSSGGTFTVSLNYAIVLFLVGILFGLIFSVISYFQGFKAIREIKENPDLYTGKGESVWGMILASLLPVLMIIYFIIKR